MKTRMTTRILNDMGVLEKLYFRWLSKKVDKKLKNEELLIYLYNKDFICFLPNDDNRLMDALKLREDFELENNTYIQDLLKNKFTSLLEVFIGISERLDHILWEKETGEQIEKWFWVLIENLNLDLDFENNDLKIKAFLNRKYLPNGRGGLFPLRHPNKDQRRVEIWYQMHAWVEENF